MEYRPEIDGLRGIAVLAVILFHAGFTTFSGGYIGVDVFFVISGYLIMSIIIHEQQAGSFTLIGFYERRVRRILPALLFMLICSIPFAVLWMNPVRLSYFATALVSVIGFASNILFWRNTTYFSETGAVNPLLHTWSLSIEEQFYLVFPVMVILLWRFGRDKIAGLVLIIGVGSFLLSEIFWQNDPAANFFLAPARIWELAVGVLLALYLSGDRAGRFGAPQFNVLRFGGGLLGLLLILAPIALFDERTPFPGVNALFPVLGTALIILFVRKRSLIGKVLGAKAPVGIGLISYSAYLWHQPLFAFSRIRGGNSLDSVATYLLILLTFLIAYLSWRFVERPFRNRARTSRRHVLRLTAFAVFLGIGVGALGYFGNGFPNRYPSNVQEMADRVLYSPKREECHTGGTDFLPPDEACVYFDGVVKWAVFGDSHVVEPAYALAERLRPRGEAVVHLSHSLCPPALLFDTRPGCREWTRLAVDRIISDPVIENVVIFYNSAAYLYGKIEDTYPELPDTLSFPYDGDEDIEGVRELYWTSFMEIVREFRAAGKRLFIVYPRPELGDNMLNMIYPRSIFDDPDLAADMVGIPRAVFLERNRQVFERLDSMPWNADLIPVRPHEWLCDDTNCFAAMGGTPYYLDNNHLSVQAARILAQQVLTLAGEESSP